MFTTGLSSFSHRPRCFVPLVLDTLVSLVNVPLDYTISLSLTAIELAKSLLRTRFDISDGGSATYILGVSIEHKQDSISLHQHGFIERTLSKFQDLILSIQKPIPIHCSTQTTKEVENSNTIPIATAQSIIGTINYLTRLTRPDLSFAQKYISQIKQSEKITSDNFIQLLGYLSRTKTATQP